MAYLYDMVSFIFDESSELYKVPPNEKLIEKNEIGKAQRRVQVKKCWDENVATVEKLEWVLNGIKEVRGRVTMRDILREFKMKPTHAQKDILDDGWDRKSGDLRLKIAGKPRIKSEGMIVEIYPKIKKLEDDKNGNENRGISRMVQKVRALFKK